MPTLPAFTLPALLLLSVAVAAPALAADGIREQRVHFPAGTSGTTLKGHLKGDQTQDYVLGARAGQRLEVDLQTNNASAYFNVLPPGSETALFVGSSGGNHFEGTLPADGDYRVRVYLMRSAARRGETADYRLGLRIDGGAATTAAPRGDFADGLSGGPDFWEVTGVAADDTLNIRRDPRPKGAVVVGVANGTVLENHGCAMRGGQRWCQVNPRGVPAQRGWVAGRYLRESSR